MLPGWRETARIGDTAKGAGQTDARPEAACLHKWGLAVRSIEPESGTQDSSTASTGIDGWLNTLGDLDTMLETIEAPSPRPALRERGRLIIEPPQPDSTLFAAS